MAVAMDLPPSIPPDPDGWTRIAFSSGFGMCLSDAGELLGLARVRRPDGSAYDLHTIDELITLSMTAAESCVGEVVIAILHPEDLAELTRELMGDVERSAVH